MKGHVEDCRERGGGGAYHVGKCQQCEGSLQANH